MDVPAPPTVPGFTLETLVRFSRSGETWLGHSADGEPVSATLVGGALASSAESLRIFRHADAVPVTEVVAAGRNLALISPVVDACTLASVRAARPVLDPGEVVTIGLAIARSLAAAHDRGIVHGDLDPVDIVIDSDGRPLLAGLGVAGLSGSGVAPADDVHALAMILRSLLGDDVGPRAEAIRGALGSALSGHPAGRPEAAELAGSLSLACPPQPLRLSVAEPAESNPLPTREPVRARDPLRTRDPLRGRDPSRARDRKLVPARNALARAAGHSASGPPWRVFRPSPTAVTAALAVAGLLLIVLAAPVFGHHGDTARTASAGAPAAAGSTTVTPPTTPVIPATSAVTPATSSVAPTPAVPSPAGAPRLSATQWQHTLQRLVTARDQAFTRLDPGELADADAVGSSAASIDASRVAALTAAKVHAAGLSSTVLGVTVVDAGTEAATLRFEESATAYDLVTAGGIVIEHRPAEPAQEWSVALVRTAAGWRTATAAAA